jgi:GlpG protein
MTAQQVIVTELQADLLPFSQLLWQRGIRHRIHEQAGQQVLSVDGNENAKLVAALYRDFQAGTLAAPQEPRRAKPSPDKTSWRRWLVLAPVTLSLVLGCVLGALVYFLGAQSLWQLLTFLPWSGSSATQGSVADVLQSGEWWRLWTPIFLHFGIIHVVFNSLWLWEFGRRIEVLQGHGRLLALVVLIALGSNVTQYLVSSSALFGGMSGVVCGLVGYCWGWSLLRPGQDFGMPKNLYYVFIGMIVLMWVLGGAFTLFGFQSIVADAAHLSGFILGFLAGVVLALLSSRGADSY